MADPVDDIRLEPRLLEQNLPEVGRFSDERRRDAEVEALRELRHVREAPRARRRDDEEFPVPLRRLLLHEYHKRLQHEVREAGPYCGVLAEPLDIV